MDRLSAVTDVPRIVVQRRNRFNSASLILSAHQVVIQLDAGPESHDASDPAALLPPPVENQPSGQLPLRSLYAASPGENIAFALHLLGHVARLPSVPISSPYADTLSTSHRAFPIRIQLKNFESLTLYFGLEHVCQDVFRALRTCTVLRSLEQLAAFSPENLRPDHPGKTINGLAESQPVLSGWSVYDLKKEFDRQGVWSRTRAWRTTTLNTSHSFCPTYPSMLVVPSRISDTTLQHGAKFRSKCRIPALTYLHWAHLGTITRSSQPLVGLRYSRSVQDEKLIDAIFSSHLFAGGVKERPALSSGGGEEGQTADSVLGAFDAIDSAEAPTSLSNQPIYGAKTTNVIIDARPTTNAYANHAKGAGSETMDYYPGCRKVFLGIDNIHVMRDSLKLITDALIDADVPAGFSSDGHGALLPLDPGQMKRSGWLKHISTLLEGAEKIVRTVHVECAHVLIHCSDGWDRTSQLSAVAQVCLDPYFRTFQGFAVLIEKDFAAFGHRFMDRTGHLSHTNIFVDRYQASPESESDSDLRNGGFEAAHAASALWGFTKSVAANLRGPQDRESVTHPKEISPVFHQFLDCVYQLHRQFPERFEFSTGWLVELQTALHECTTGTFLFNSEAERMQSRRRFPALKSVWDSLLSAGTKLAFQNPRYDPQLNDICRPKTDMGVLMPNGKNIRLWPALFRRSDQDLNAYIDVERAAQAEVAAQRDARRKRLEQRLEAVAQGSALPSPQVIPDENGVAPATPEAPDEYVGLAYRPYQSKAKSHKLHKPFDQAQDTSRGSTQCPSPNKSDVHLSPTSYPSSEDQGWDPAAVGKRQVRALWSAGRGWLFGGEHLAGSEGENPWDTAPPMQSTPAAISKTVPATAIHDRNGSASSWDVNVWSDPPTDPLNAGFKELHVSAPPVPHIASVERVSESSHASARTSTPAGRDPDPLINPLSLSTSRTLSVNDPSRPMRVPPPMHPLDSPLTTGDPLGASWSSTNLEPKSDSLAEENRSSPITRSSPSHAPTDPSALQVPNSNHPPSHLPSRASSPSMQNQQWGSSSPPPALSTTQPTISHRAQVSSDPLGVL